MMSETMTNALAVFSYEGNAITFKSENGVMVNATEMAKPFGKLVKDWLANKSTREFLEELSAVRRIPLTGSETSEDAEGVLVRVVQGGTPSLQGTWLHEDVALEFARWLNPKFAIWCNDRIKELLTQGVTTISDDDDVIRKAMEVLNRRLEDKERKLREAQERIDADRPKVLFANAIIGSQRSCLIGELAKILRQNGVEIGEKRLFQWLRDNKYLGAKGERHNIPNQEYMERGYFELKTNVFSTRDGVMRTTRTTKVTPKGQEHIIQKFIGLQAG